MAASADRIGKVGLPGGVIDFPLGVSKTVYKGTMVVVDSSTGYAEAGSDAAAKRFVGVSATQAVNTATAGEYSVPVYTEGQFEFTVSGGAQTMVGSYVYLSDDETVCIASGSSYHILAGVVTEYISSTKVKVDITAGVKGVNLWGMITGSFSGEVTHSARTSVKGMEFPFPVSVQRIYLRAETAPGNHKTTLTIQYSTLAGTAVTKTLDMSTTATEAENENADFSIPANRDVTISAVDSAASALTANLHYVIEYVREAA